MSHLITVGLTKEDNVSLLTPHSKEELRVAMKSIPVDDSPGLDDFGSGFFLTCWDFIKEDLLETVTKFFNGVPIPRFFSTSFIVLIPKGRTLLILIYSNLLVYVRQFIRASLRSLSIGYQAICIILFLLNKELSLLDETSLRISLWLRKWHSQSTRNTRVGM